MAKAKLEKVLEYLINRDEDKARDLLHQVIVEKAKEIHESLMQDEEENLEEHGESLEQPSADQPDEEMELEEYFDNDDLSEAPADDDAAGDIADDMLVNMGDDDDAPDADAEGGEEDADGGDADTAELEAAIQELQAEFDRLQAEVADLKGDTGGEAGDDMPPIDDAEETPEAVDNFETSDQEDDQGDQDFFEELDALLGEDQEEGDLTEAIIDDLHVIKHDPAEDRYVGDPSAPQPGKALRSSPVVPRGTQGSTAAKPIDVNYVQSAQKPGTGSTYKQQGTGKFAYDNIQKTADEKLERVQGTGPANSILATGRHKDDPSGWDTSTADTKRKQPRVDGPPFNKMADNGLMPSAVPPKSQTSPVKVARQSEVNKKGPFPKRPKVQ